jgi:hypothetical protein
MFHKNKIWRFPPHPNPLLEEREFVTITPLLLQEKGPGDEVD